MVAEERILTACLTLHDASKRLLARFIVNEPDPLEAYARLGIAVADRNFTAEESRVISKLIDQLHQEAA